MVNKLNRPDGNGKLVFVNTIYPLTDPTAGSSIIHRNQAAMFHDVGYDVVVLEATNRPVAPTPQGPYKVRGIFFDGRDPKSNPVYNDDPKLYNATNPVLGFNFPVFLSHPASTTKFIELTDEQIGQYVMSWAWAMRSAMLVYGVPDAAWNSHTWILNCLSASVPTIFTVHGSAVSHEGGYREERLRPLNQLGVDRAFFAAAISAQELDNITDPNRYGMDPNRVQVIWNSYNEDIFRPDLAVTKNDVIKKHGDKLGEVDPDKPWVVFAGGAAHFRGVDNLVAAMRKVNEETGAHLIILGAGDYGRVEAPDGSILNLYSMVEKFNLMGRVHFVGAITPAETAEVIKVSDVYTLPSRKEPFGLVAIEGMGVGKTPILTASGGFLDIVGNRTDVARMVQAENPDCEEVLKQAMGHISRNRDLPEPKRTAVIDILMASMIGSDPDLSGRYNGTLIKEARILADKVRTLYARRVAISSLSDGIMAELGLTPEERAARGAVSVKYARDRFGIKTVVTERMVPLLERAIREGRRADFGFDDMPVAQHPKRQERLDNISIDTDVALTYQQLLQNIGTRQFGSAWRAFDNTVAYYLGHASLLYPYDPAGLPDFANEPNDVFSEVARAAGVSTAEMFETMHYVEAAPVELLIPTLMRHL